MLMRLAESQALAIGHVIREELGADSCIWLFGSRVDDCKRGGDIDLYVESPTSVSMTKKLAVVSKIQRAIGLRKIDLIVNDGYGELKPIYTTAKEEGVRL